MDTQDEITRLLLSTNRGCMEQLVDWLVAEGFFIAPASTRFHGSYSGGLADHSLRVKELLLEQCARLQLYNGDTSSGKKPLKIVESNIVIACLTHDICKVGAYIPQDDEDKPYKWNKQQPEGHAELSIERIKKFIVLEPVEEIIIRFHMGNFGLYEFYDPSSWEYKTQPEYHLRSLTKKKKGMSPEEKKADQEARYGKSWRNGVYHNPVIFWMHVADMQATAEEKAKES